MIFKKSVCIPSEAAVVIMAFKIQIFYYYPLIKTFKNLIHFHKNILPGPESSQTV